MRSHAVDVLTWIEAAQYGFLAFVMLCNVRPSPALDDFVVVASPVVTITLIYHATGGMNILQIQ